MSRLLAKHLADSAVEARHMTASGKQSVLESKILAIRNGLLNVTADGSSVDVSAGVAAVAKNTGVYTTDGSGKGTYTGAISGDYDPLKVHVRAYQSDNGILDDVGDEVYAALTEVGGTVTASFFNSDGTTYTFATPTAVDLYFVEYVDLYQASPMDLLLLGGVSGVVDATQASALTAYQASLASTANGEGASLIGSEDAGGYFTGDNVEAILQELGAFDASLASTANGAGASLIGVEDAGDNFTATTLEDVLAELAAADTSLATNTQALVQAEADARVAADNALASDISDLQAADATLQSNIDALNTSLSSAISAEATARADADSALDTRVTALEGKVPSTELITLTATNITNKSFDLATTPSLAEAVQLFPLGGLPQSYADDFTMSGTTVSWTGLGMDDLGLVAGDKIRVYYQS